MTNLQEHIYKKLVETNQNPEQTAILIANLMESVGEVAQMEKIPDFENLFDDELKKVTV